MMADPQLLEWLRQLRGIEREYFDFRGQHRRVSDESLERILAAFHHRLDDDAGIMGDARQLSEKDWRRVVPPAIVLRPARDNRIAITVLRPLLETITWRVSLEEGGDIAGDVALPELPVLEERALDDMHFVRLALSLPSDIPTGYHRLRLESADGHLLGDCRLIVAPERCHEPESLSEGQRLWGLAIQLYSVRSRRNWGIGDFTDLRTLVGNAVSMGIDVIGLNPLHALFPADPHLNSPYSPASRQFLNPVYVDPEAVAEFARCRPARDLVADDAFQARLSALRECDLVDYAGVAEVKDQIFRLLFRCFEDEADSERRHNFEHFVERHGKDLISLGVYYALQGHFSAVGSTGGWQAWPQAYHNRDSESVRAFAANHRDEVQYHMYLQWLAHEQLAAVEATARKTGMKVGIYRDLAVGVNGGGAEAWADQELYTSGATIGAPPDPLALQGQDWGIPPMRPDVLRERGYQPFIDLLRANMGRGGALRIDHVMVLYRLWWVPAGRPSAEGTYVYYDLDAMMGILALESQRHRCLVIGEDLGTVPEAIRHAMPDFGVYSYRVFYFEHDEDGAPRRPANYPEHALVTVSTHDLPPLASFWRATDIELREQLALYPDAATREETLASRVRQRRLILSALHQAGLHTRPEEQTDRLGEPISKALAEAIQVYLAMSRAKLMVVQPEDWLYMEAPVNVPGTSDEHANWQRKLSADLEDWLDRDAVRHVARRITDARRSGTCD
jgi:4-alpha-glucanotransferase